MRRKGRGKGALPAPCCNGTEYVLKLFTPACCDTPYTATRPLLHKDEAVRLRRRARFQVGWV